MWIQNMHVTLFSFLMTKLLKKRVTTKFHLFVEVLNASTFFVIKNLIIIKVKQNENKKTPHSSLIWAFIFIQKKRCTTRKTYLSIAFWKSPFLQGDCCKLSYLCKFQVDLVNACSFILPYCSVCNGRLYMEGYHAFIRKHRCYFLFPSVVLYI